MATTPGLWKSILLFASLSSLSPSIGAILPGDRLHGNVMRPPGIPIVTDDANITPKSLNGTQLPPITTTYFFNQLIDHTRPSLGTFQQRYWHTWEFYKPGGPIILMTPGESNAQPYYHYLTNSTINGRIAQQQNGATIVLEHRFYGLSNPRPDLTVESLRLHTIQQAIDDLAYFAYNVNLPMPGGDKVTPDEAPWILVGGSYAGALTSWTMVNKPGVFFAGYASSAVVEAILDFWKYFEPIRQNMPQNCSADVQAVIRHIDSTFTGTNATAIQGIKDMFGMTGVTHLDDVAGALRNNLWDWQSLQPTTGPGALFYKFCDALEVKNGTNAPASGWGLDHALPAWAAYFKTAYFPILCGNMTAEDCLGTYNATQAYYTDTRVDNASRSWFWIVCNEVGYLQEGAPVWYPSLVSRLIQPPYDLRQCQLMFPAAFPQLPQVQTIATNLKYHGWNVRENRLFFANGIRDPWRDATVSADGLFIPSTPQQPIKVGDGFHCTDMGTSSGLADPTVGAVQTAALAAMKGWLAQWKPSGISPTKNVTGGSEPDVGQENIQSPKPVNAFFKSSGTF